MVLAEPPTGLGIAYVSEARADLQCQIITYPKETYRFFFFVICAVCFCLTSHMDLLPTSHLAEKHEQGEGAVR
jgi:hypothetical protein